MITRRLTGNKIKSISAAVMAAILGVSLLIPAAPAQAVPQTLPFPVYVNGMPVTIQNAILYNDFTYVQLRDLAKVTNMSVEFNDPAMPFLPPPGGALPTGINIDQPTFVYTKDNVPNWLGEGLKTVDKAVDITTLYHRYFLQENLDTPTNSMKYYFHPAEGGGVFVAADESGKTVKTPVHVFTSEGKEYVSVDEFRSVIQPYLVDMCMQ